MQAISFVKMNGLGNDFVLIDAISSSLAPDQDTIKEIADRRLGVGCDQVLWLTAADNGVLYRVFNADGSEVAQCGNGARCVGHYMSVMHSYKAWPLRLITCSDAVLLVNKIDDCSYSVDMGIPKSVSGSISDQHEVEFNGDKLVFQAVDVGNPHAIFIADDCDIDQLGQFMQKNQLFPHGVNVSLVRYLSTTKVAVSVYERGVGRTEACGSAAAAVVVAGVYSNRLSPGNVTVDMPGGELQVQFSYKNCVQYGAVEWVFVGSWQSRKSKKDIFYYD